ncbi:hypothetical protein M434DRAFT_126689 [Hypoxylon sp. CO27-5]|nr:hypothetical protein M434DRAFT_126689 [Hypoxylon sp. CO27-5]
MLPVADFRTRWKEPWFLTVPCPLILHSGILFSILLMRLAGTTTLAECHILDLWAWDPESRSIHNDAINAYHLHDWTVPLQLQRRPMRAGIGFNQH